MEKRTHPALRVEPSAELPLAGAESEHVRSKLSVQEAARVRAFEQDGLSS